MLYSFDTLPQSIKTCLPQFNHDLLEQKLTQLQILSREAIHIAQDKRIQEWTDSLSQLPGIDIEKLTLDHQLLIQGRWQSSISIDMIKTLLMAMHPWRKGPFHLPQFSIDTEWRSDWKWDRVASHIGSLQDKMILDVGCGNGYYMWRMCGMGARLVLGVDPTRVFHFQYHVFHQWLSTYILTHTQQHVHHLPLALEHLVAIDHLPIFDYVFSMGVLYHRRDPLLHLKQLKQQINPKGGCLVLETLVHQGDQPLWINKRYARMRNMWCLPDLDTVVQWMTQAGFTQIKLLDLTMTTVKEQRRTEWMWFESLAHALDPNDHTRTIEGYPAPLRATWIAKI